MIIGVFILYFGLFCVIIGISIWINKFLKYKKNRIKKELLITSFIALLVLFNIPIGFCIFLKSYSIHTEYIVEIQNASPYEVKDLILDGGGVYESIRLIKIGEKK